MKKIILSMASVVFVSAMFTSCTDDSLTPKVVDKVDITTSPITSVDGLKMAVNGAYKYMMQSPYYGRDYIIYNEVHSDNAFSNGNSGRFVNEAEFRTLLTSGYASDTWNTIYQVIAMANIAINADITTGDAEEINDYKAQAYAIRALAHFDLMKLYGQQNVTASTSSLTVPYVTVYGSVTSENYNRLSLEDFNTKLSEDLNLAETLASDDITVKNKFNKQSILGLKARVALYMAPFFGETEYTNAYTYANQAIALGGQVATATQFVSTFANGVEGVNSVFDLQFLSNDNNGVNSLFQIYGNTPYGDIFAANNVKTVLFADANDVRGTLVTNVSGVLRNTGKYLDRSDNIRLMRFEELVLTAAEGAIRANNESEALTLINQITANRGAAEYTTVTLTDVLNERRKELIFEGFRFDDLMRTQSNIPTITERAAHDTPEYGDDRLAFPIPQSETNTSPIIQNQGY